MVDELLREECTMNQRLLCKSPHEEQLFETTYCLSELEHSVTPSLESPIGPYDVVCGKDRVAHTHEGNKWFRTIVQQYRKTYQGATRRKDKTRIAEEIVSVVEAKSGRFVKFDDQLGIWTEVGRAVVHEKVSHALRSARDPTLVSKRSKRCAASRPVPTPDEDNAFQEMLGVQQILFVELSRQERGGSRRAAAMDSNRDFFGFLLDSIDSL